MSLRFAILGLLSHRPSSGYDIKATFDKGMSLGWNASESQIYRTLSALADEELVGVRSVIQDGRPNKRIFSITERGIQALDEWLASDLGSPYEKDPFLLRFFFMERLEEDQIRKLLNQRYEQLASELDDSRQLAAQYSDVLTHRHPRRLWWQLKVLDSSIRQLEVQMSWVKECLELLDEGVPWRIPIDTESTSRMTGDDAVDE